MKIGFIGAGNVGTALAYLLKEAGFEVEGIASRRFSSACRAAAAAGVRAVAEAHELAAECDALFITTPDGAIEDVCRSLADRGSVGPGHILIHTSGAQSTRSLESAGERGAGVLSLHPLQTVASFEEGKKNLPGSYFSAEGDARGIALAKRLVESLEGRLVEIPTGMKPLYHASACAASNYIVAMVHLALRMLEGAGISREEGLEALFPLIRGALHNIEAVGIPHALTGPISRGDRATILAQLKNMEEVCPEILPVYRIMGSYTVGVAEEKGTLGKEAAEEMRKILEV